MVLLVLYNLIERTNEINICKLFLTEEKTNIDGERILLDEKRMLLSKQQLKFETDMILEKSKLDVEKTNIINTKVQLQKEKLLQLEIKLNNERISTKLDIEKQYLNYLQDNINNIKNEVDEQQKCIKIDMARNTAREDYLKSKHDELEKIKQQLKEEKLTLQKSTSKLMLERKKFKEDKLKLDKYVNDVLNMKLEDIVNSVNEQ